MVHAVNKEKYSLINRIAIANRASLEEVDRRSPYSAILICHERTTMTLETLENTIFVRFYFTLLSNANPSAIRRPYWNCSDYKKYDTSVSPPVLWADEGSHF